MALGIEGATIGIDEGGVQTALNNLHVGVIENTIQTMRGKLSELQASVDAGWVGASAEQFKKNMAADQDSVAKGLEETYDVLKGEFAQIVDAMKEADENLIAGRGN